MFGKKKDPDSEESKVKKAKKPRKEKKEKREKKEKKSKEPKQPKEKKPKREKKPKPPKKPKPKKDKKPMNPLILVILLLVVVIIGGGAAFVVMNKQKEKEEDDMYGPMYFFTEADGIESIRSKIGDREIKGGYQGPVDLTAEQAAEESEQEDGKDSENSGEETGTPQESTEEITDPELEEVDIKLLTDQHLTYITPGDGVAEAEKYMTYLLQEKNFKILTYPEGSEGEIPREPVQTPAAEEGEDEEQEAQEEEKTGFVPPEQGYYIAAVDNKDDAAEGDPSELKRIRMEYTRDSYELRLSTANGEVDDLIPPEPEEEPIKRVTMSSAIDKLEAMSDAQLQLPKSLDHYEMTPIQGKTILHGIEFYNVRAYEAGPDDTLLYGGSYYVSCEGDTVYKHDEATGERTLVSGVDILAGIEPEDPVKNVVSMNGELNSTVMTNENP